jgi:hypothetical protein
LVAEPRVDRAGVVRRARRFESAAAGLEGGEELTRRFHADAVPQGRHEVTAVVGPFSTPPSGTDRDTDVVALC